MTASLREADLPVPVRLRREARQAAWSASRETFTPRPAASEWPATRLSHSTVLGLITRSPFTGANPGTRNMRIRGANLAVGWLADQPGGSWQQRWLASGAEAAGPGWKQDCAASWLDAHGTRAGDRMIVLSMGVILAICADLFRPSLRWLAASGVSPGALARNLERSRDRAGFTRLRETVSAGSGVTDSARHATIGRAAIIVAAKGGTLADVMPGDFLELLDAERQVHGRPRDYSAVSWRLLRQAGAFGPDAPGTLAQLLTIGQRSPAELIDRYQLACQPVRDLLVDYLQERQPALDHRSLDTLAQQLGRNFWQDLERHHPGIASLSLPPEVAAAWKQRLRTKTTAASTADAAAARVTGPRLTSRHTLLAVRALYLDLACWATEDPARWGPWAVPSPVTKADVNSRKEDRRRKSRMDSRTRERLPVLPVLARSAAGHRASTAQVLLAALAAPPGGTFTVAGQAFTRLAARKPGIRTWARDSSGKRRDLIWEEDHAFWTWAIIEVLRASGIRIEELLELTHHSLIQYRLPSHRRAGPAAADRPVQDRRRTAPGRLTRARRRARRGHHPAPRRRRRSPADCPIRRPRARLAAPGRCCSSAASAPSTGRSPPQRVRNCSTGNALAAPASPMRPGSRSPSPRTTFAGSSSPTRSCQRLPPHIAQVIAGHRTSTSRWATRPSTPGRPSTPTGRSSPAAARCARPRNTALPPTPNGMNSSATSNAGKSPLGDCGRAFATPCIS